MAPNNICRSSLFVVVPLKTMSFWYLEWLAERARLWRETGNREKGEEDECMFWPHCTFWRDCIDTLYFLERLYGEIVWRDCIDTLYWHIVWTHCIDTLYGHIVWTHCMDTLYGHIDTLYGHIDTLYGHIDTLYVLERLYFWTHVYVLERVLKRVLERETERYQYTRPCQMSDVVEAWALPANDFGAQREITATVQLHTHVQVTQQYTAVYRLHWGERREERERVGEGVERSGEEWRDVERRGERSG